MKNKKAILFSTIVVILIGLSVLLDPLGLMSKQKSYFEFEDGVNLDAFKYADFYISVKNNNGDIHKVNVNFVGDETKYVGIANIPGDVNTNDCRITWDSDSSLNLQKGIFKYNKEKLKIATANNEIIFVVKCDGKKYDFMLTTFKGSSAVESLFIDIDETLGTIDDMNNDPGHNTECFGKAIFGEKEHFISIKGRGNSTWDCGGKRPYNITFYEDEYETKTKVSMIEGTEAKKWSLLANFVDPTLMRNKLGYDLANSMDIGLPSKHYDIWMNGEYLGNYLITPKNDYQAPKDGYALELDNKIDYEDPQFVLEHDGVEDYDLLFTIKNNDADVDELEIKAYIENVWNSIEDFESEDYQKYIDINSFAKMYLMYEIDKNRDCISGSMLMHRDGINEDDKLIAGPIWDLDRSFGNIYFDKDNKMPYEKAISADYWYIDSIEMPEPYLIFFQELGKHQSFIGAVKENYQEYKEQIDNLKDNVKNLQAQIYDSALMDWNNWKDFEHPIGDYNFKVDKKIVFENGLLCESNIEEENLSNPLIYIQTNEYQNYVSNLVSYINARLTFLENNINKK